MRPFFVAWITALVFVIGACKGSDSSIGKDSSGWAIAAEATPSASWKRVEQLISEQKFDAAVKEVAGIRAKAIAARNEAEWTRALIKEVQLRIGLHGYETAVRFLMEQPWPKGDLAQAALNLYYGHALTTYLGAYSWEIGQRERQSGETKTVDLRGWTREQIHGEAVKAYAKVWERREGLGREPISRLAEYMAQNSYPAGIRDTLRDAVSYMFVALQADTSGWSAADSNDLFRLPKPQLIRGGTPSKINMKDPAIHPITRLGAILDDLEAWHRQKGSREGELEARLERLRRLHVALADADDREEVRADLENRLPSFRKLPWWSMGMAQLAEFTRTDDAKGNLVRARQFALEGHRAYPDFIGGQRCLSIARQIEAPDYQLAGMASDGPGKRSLQVTHKNLDALYYRAYPIDLMARLAKITEWDLLPNSNEIHKLLGGRIAAAWHTTLPGTPDYKSHVTYVTPPELPPGLYAVVASARQDFERGPNRVVAVHYLVSDLVLLSHADGKGGLFVDAVSGASGNPIAGAQVWLYQRNWRVPPRRVAEGRANDKGTVHFAWQPRVEMGESTFLAGRKGENLALDAAYFSLYKPSEPGENTSALVYTDRSIYRPQQKLDWKVLLFHGNGEQARYRTVPDRDILVWLADPNGEQLASASVNTNEFGTASGTFTVPAGRLLGSWSIQTNYGGSAQVRVEEYKRPTFEVKINDPVGALRLNRPAKLTAEARYYFGLPVSGGQARWRVTRLAQYADWWYWGWWGHAPQSQRQTIAAGGGPITPEGKVEIAFTPEADEKTKGAAAYQYALSLDATDEGGETRSTERTFRLAKVAVEATVRAEDGFILEGATADLTVVRTNLDGVPRAGLGTWRLLAIQQPKHPALPAEEPAIGTALGAGASPENADFSTPGDRLRPRWMAQSAGLATMALWKDGPEALHGTSTHGANGDAAIALPALSPGAYRFRYETADEFGARFETFKDLLVVGRKATPLALSAVLLAQDSSVKVGGKARIFVHTGFDDQVLFYDVYRSGKLVQRRQLNGGLIEIPIKDADRGGFGVTLTMVRDHQIMTGNATVFVPWDDKELRVSFETFRDKLRPGGNETWRVHVSGPGGAKLEAGSAEILAYMFDKSLDLFGPHSPPDPLALYPNLTGVGWARSNLGSAQQMWLWDDGFASVPGYPGFSGDSLRFYDNYGIGGPGQRQARPMMSRSAGGQRMADEAAPAAAPEGGAPSRKNKVVGQEKEEYRSEKQDGPAEQKQATPAAQAPLRSNFSETAFFKPHLVLGKSGRVTLEFKVPDSVTAWNVWVHAVTRDLEAGSLHVEAKTAKDLMVRPYMPRFLREGDKASLRVVVNNATDKPQSGNVTINISDPDTGASLNGEFGLSNGLRLPFNSEGRRQARVTVDLTVPRRVGTVAFKVVAQSGDTSDGELRPIPVLPGRMHLTQSRFVTLKNADRRVMSFPDLAKGDDPTLSSDAMVVTVDAQLFYSVLSSLPYLIDYPYECTEQTLNRFVSTGIVSSLYHDYPAIARMGQEFSKRETANEAFDGVDPNRKMTLEESPWLVESRGGKADDSLKQVLDPKVAEVQRDLSLGKLRKAQLPSGAFPWWAGGAPSEFMTLYMMHGFAKAAEFGVGVPKDVVVRGWNYLADEIRRDIHYAFAHDCCWEFLTMANYVASSYPDKSWTGGALTAKEREQILAFSFKHWKRHSPYLKGYLALTLKRMDRPGDAKLVWDSVMDSAKSTQDEGTSWAPEERAWLWYNDTIETHAFALRTLTELQPKDSRRDGLVQWLILNKKLNHWKSTRATAEVLYSLVHYLKQEGALQVRENATVEVGPKKVIFNFEPDKYTGKKNQIVLPGAEVSPKTANVTVSKTSKGLAFASATWHYATDTLPKEDRGNLLAVSRKFFKREHGASGPLLSPIADGGKLAIGDQVEVHLSLRALYPAEYVHLRDPRASGLEPENQVSRHRWDHGLSWYEEIRDSGTNFFIEALPQGEYTLKYRIRAAMAGVFKVAPATVESMYAPEFHGFSAGTILHVRTPGL